MGAGSQPGLCDAVAGGEGGRLSSISAIRLVEDAGYMVGDSATTDDQRLGNLRVTFSGSDQLDDFDFPRAEAGREAGRSRIELIL